MEGIHFPWLIIKTPLYSKNKKLLATFGCY